MALFAVAKCLGWNEKDHILLSAMSFVAGANAISSVKSKPVFVDIDKYFNLDADKTEKKIIELKKNKKKVKAIIVTDYGGNPANWEKFLSLKRKYNLILINDNCHSLGSKVKGDKSYALKYADIVIQSFHAAKNITSAEGGGIITNNKKYYLKLKSLREHGFKVNKINNPWNYELNSIGYNARLSELNCALGSSQMDRLSYRVKKRNSIAKFYDKIFKKFNVIKIPEIPKENYCSYHLYPLRFDWKKLKITKYNFYNLMRKKYGINLQIHYKPTYKFKFYKSKMKIKLSDFKNTENFYREVFSIPLYDGLNKKELIYITKAITKTIKSKI
jgi:dTDP-4-amino-4,6-dideoxygalactose transaminase